jgi:hypothetical protein
MPSALDAGGNLELVITKHTYSQEREFLMSLKNSIFNFRAKQNYDHSEMNWSLVPRGTNDFLIRFGRGISGMYVHIQVKILGVAMSTPILFNEVFMHAPVSISQPARSIR